MRGDGGDRSLGIVPAFLRHRESWFMGPLLNMLMGTGAEKCIQARSSNNHWIKLWRNLLSDLITPMPVFTEMALFMAIETMAIAHSERLTPVCHLT